MTKKQILLAIIMFEILAICMILSGMGDPESCRESPIGFQACMQALRE